MNEFLSNDILQHQRFLFVLLRIYTMTAEAIITRNDQLINQWAKTNRNKFGIDTDNIQFLTLICFQVSIISNGFKRGIKHNKL